VIKGEMYMSITIKIEIDGREVVNQKVEETKKMESKSYSSYAKFFDETSTYWSKDAEYNLMFLLQVQQHANNVLRSRYSENKVGWLFLNEVYEMLGLPKTKAGQIVGWIYKENNTDGDNYVDFGIFNSDKNAKFVNGFEKSIILDFNVDGPIIDKM
jgi:hypothetical protein